MTPHTSQVVGFVLLAKPKLQSCYVEVPITEGANSLLLVVKLPFEIVLFAGVPIARLAPAAAHLATVLTPKFKPIGRTTFENLLQKLCSEKSKTACAGSTLSPVKLLNVPPLPEPLPIPILTGHFIPTPK